MGEIKNYKMGRTWMAYSFLQRTKIFCLEQPKSSIQRRGNPVANFLHRVVADKARFL